MDIDNGQDHFTYLDCGWKQRPIRQPTCTPMTEEEITELRKQWVKEQDEIQKAEEEYLRLRYSKGGHCNQDDNSTQ